jgi:NADH:ubiquinone oxidoreductase subunit 6 (subunit J)
MNIYKVIFYYIGIIIVCIVFINMLYNLVTKKYKEKLSKEQLSKNPKIQYFQHAFILQELFFRGYVFVQLEYQG